MVKPIEVAYSVTVLNVDDPTMIQVYRASAKSGVEVQLGHPEQGVRMIIRYSPKAIRFHHDKVRGLLAAGVDPWITEGVAPPGGTPTV